MQTLLVRSRGKRGQLDKCAKIRRVGGKVRAQSNLHQVAGRSMARQRPQQTRNFTNWLLLGCKIYEDVGKIMVILRGARICVPASRFYDLHPSRSAVYPRARNSRARATHYQGIAARSSHARGLASHLHPSARRASCAQLRYGPNCFSSCALPWALRAHSLRKLSNAFS